MARLDASSTSRSAPLVLLSTSVLVVRIKTSDLSPVDWSPDMEICRQDPAQEDLRARGAREAQPVQEGLLGQVTLLIPTPNCGQLVVFFRVHANEVKKTEAKTTGKKGAPCKRLPKVTLS